MSTFGKLRRSNSRSKALSRPFARSILAKAGAIVERYRIVLNFEEGEWYGHGLEIPTAFGEGRTAVAAVADTRRALATAVAYMLEKGERPPAPAREGNRSVQVNVRLTAEEKALLESRAKARGFRGLSDFIRAAVLMVK